MHTFSFLMLYFSVFAFAGWLIECSYCCYKEKRISNRGFLYGPFVPLYGFGALCILAVDWELSSGSVAVEIVIATLLVVALEYITSLLFEKIFTLRLWDYSTEFCNLRGRVCLKYSLCWALLIIIQLVFIQPSSVKSISAMPVVIQDVLAVVLSLYFLLDLFFSSKSLLRFSKIVAYIDIEHRVTQMKTIWIDLPARIKASQITRPLEQFPHLKHYFMSQTQGIIKGISDLRIVTNKNKELQDNRLFSSFVEPIVSHPVYQQLRNYQHHDGTIYDHSLGVAWATFKIGRRLNLKTEDAVKGALLHDFFLYNWRNSKEAPGKFHGLTHPGEAYRNSLKYFAPLSPVVKDIIIRHMWPLTPIPPRYLESILVCLIDKSVATKEVLNWMHNGAARKCQKMLGTRNNESVKRKTPQCNDKVVSIDRQTAIPYLHGSKPSEYRPIFRDTHERLSFGG